MREKSPSNPDGVAAASCELFAGRVLCSGRGCGILDVCNKTAGPENLEMLCFSCEFRALQIVL